MSERSEKTGDDWIQLAESRIATASHEINFLRNVGGPTKSSLFRIYSELEAASQHLLDASFAFGLGSLR